MTYTLCWSTGHCWSKGLSAICESYLHLSNPRTVLYLMTLSDLDLCSIFQYWTLLVRRSSVQWGSSTWGKGTASCWCTQLQTHLPLKIWETSTHRYLGWKTSKYSLVIINVRFCPERNLPMKANICCTRMLRSLVDNCLTTWYWRLRLHSILNLKIQK